ncbi:MAG: GNAT family N-acetyltransferase, partial [Frankia sp.]|nr:GNAT family N-acetyltransferase [Frankia sp.]
GGLQEYIATQAQVIATCLATSDVLVACPAERPEQILGWCCFRRPSTVHYVYVKPYYRRNGIATQMLTEALQWTPKFLGPVYVSHDWRTGLGLDGINGMAKATEGIGLNIEYNPALIFGAQRQEWMPR